MVAPTVLRMIPRPNESLSPLADEVQFYRRVSKELNVECWLSTRDDFDVKIRVGEQPNADEFHAVSATLSAHSSYFNAALSSRWARKDGDVFVVELPKIAPDAFDVILSYLCSDTINLNLFQQPFLVKLLLASDELNLETLSDKIQEYLVKDQSEWTRTNMVLLLNSLFHYDGFERLRDHIFEILSNDPSILYKSKDFGSLDESVLLALLEEDKRNMGLAKVWEVIVDWAIARKPALPADASQWTDEHTNTLMERTKNALPIVWFSWIPYNDFMERLVPRAHLLPSPQYNETIGHYVRRSPSIPIPRLVLKDSALINHAHAVQLVKWIEATGPRLSRTPSRIKRLSQQLFHPRSSYNFKLVYRKSQFGFITEDYRRRCSSQNPMLVIARLRDEFTLVGGYAPFGLNTVGPNRAKPMADWDRTFLFRFGEGPDLNENARTARIVREEGGDMPFSWWGPSFGSDFYVNLETDRCICRASGSDEERLLGDDASSSVAISDCEIFEIVGDDD